MASFDKNDNTVVVVGGEVPAGQGGVAERFELGARIARQRERAADFALRPINRQVGCIPCSPYG